MSPIRSAAKIHLSIRERLTSAGLRLDRVLSMLPPALHIGLRWPGRKPWQLPRLEIASHGGGVGDELMITPALRGVKERNPACHIRFHSRYPDLFRLYPFIDEIVPLARGTLPSTARLLQYSHLTPPPRSLTHLLGEQLGLNLERLEPAPPLLPPDLRSPLELLPRPVVVIQPGGSGWTPNKQWPIERWRSLIRELLPRASVVEVGTDPLFPPNEFGPRFVNLSGRTSVIEFAAAIRDADLFIGQASAGMHLAGAFETPSIVIFGGYEHPNGIGYKQMVPFYTQLPCAPCWLTTPCPYQHACMTAIEVADLRSTAFRLLDLPRTPWQPG